jgi:bifunctional DNA-binding transcriptional regulator/antitoxin component of YhaV-PrlF toxin-antitoxin module
MVRIPIDKSGRLVLPKPIRKRLGLSDAAVLSAEIIGERLQLTPLDTTPRRKLKKKAGLLVIPATGRKSDVSEAVQQMREDREHDVLGR